MINEYQSKIPCWLVWSTSTNGLVTLESICLNEQYATQMRKVLLDDTARNFISVKVEAALANHMYAGDLDQIWWREYGEAAEGRFANLIIGARDKHIQTLEALLWNLLGCVMTALQWLGPKDDPIIKSMRNAANNANTFLRQ